MSASLDQPLPNRASAKHSYTNARVKYGLWQHQWTVADVAEQQSVSLETAGAITLMSQGSHQLLTATMTATQGEQRWTLVNRDEHGMEHNSAAADIHGRSRTPYRLTLNQLGVANGHHYHFLLPTQRRLVCLLP
jgi:arylamine N-acetyltransferase